MKILIIAKRFSNINVDNDLNIYQDGIRLKKELERQKHEVRILFYDSNIKEYKKCYSDFRPDFIFQTGIGWDFNALKELKRLGAKLVMWYPDAYWLSQESRKSKFLKAFDVFDLILTTMKGHVKIAKPYTNKVVYCSHYFDNTFYKSNKKFQKVHDAVFVGNKTNPSPQREEYFKSIIDQGYDLKIIGWGFKPLGGFINYNGELIADYYKSSKIGLNMISGGELNYDLQFSVRVYQVMGCGCFLLTEYIPKIEKMFVPGKHLDVFHTKEEMLEKIKYYLKHPKIREKIATQGQKEIFDKYTIDIVVKQYLKIIKEKLNL